MLDCAMIIPEDSTILMTTIRNGLHLLGINATIHRGVIVFFILIAVG